MSEKPHHHFHNNAAFLIDFTTFEYGPQGIQTSPGNTAPDQEKILHTFTATQSGLYFISTSLSVRCDVYDGSGVLDIIFGSETIAFSRVQGRATASNALCSGVHASCVHRLNSGDTVTIKYHNTSEVAWQDHADFCLSIARVC